MVRPVRVLGVGLGVVESWGFGVGVVERCGKHGFAKRSWNRLMEPSLAHLGRGSVLLNPAICSRDEHVEPPPA